MSKLHRCETKTCHNLAPERARFCAECILEHKRECDRRRARSKRRYDKYVDYTASTPPTSLTWLNKFSGYANSGLPYSQYQRMESGR